LPFVPSARAEEGILSIGSISNEPREEAAEWQPFIDYVVSHLKKAGIIQGNFVVTISMQEMVNRIKKGEVDIYIDSPFPIFYVCKLSGAKPFLRRWKKGVKEYSSVIFVRRDSNINTIEDLRGKIVAFEESFSTSSYFLPKATLMKEGLTLTEKKDFLSSVSSNEVGYVFSGDDETTMVWVLRKMISGGALHSTDFKQLAKDGISELKILTETINVPRQVVSHRADLNPELVAAIEKVLLNMDKDEEGKKVLKIFERTAKFDKFDKGAEETLRPIENLVDFIEKDLSD
jgi:phosphonate transport system substrate-binding protein